MYMDEYEKAVRRINENQGRGIARTPLEHAVLEERMRRDRKALLAIAVAAVLLVVVALFV